MWNQGRGGELRTSDLQRFSGSLRRKRPRRREYAREMGVVIFSSRLAVWGRGGALLSSPRVALLTASAIARQMRKKKVRDSSVAKLLFAMVVVRG